MKKIGKIINLKNIMFFILGGIIFGGVTVAVAGTIYSSQVTYTKNGQSTVEGALDELYTRASTYIDPSFFEIPVFANKTGVYIILDNQIHFFRVNNWDYEQNHMKQVFGNDKCVYTNSESLECNKDNYNYRCFARAAGRIACQKTDSWCAVESDGSIMCV